MDGQLNELSHYRTLKGDWLVPVRSDICFRTWGKGDESKDSIVESYHGKEV